MELSIVSEEYIKPSSSTPHHRRTHLLSSWDQMISSDHGCITLFYAVGADISTLGIRVDDIFKKRLGLLKQSLSETLSSFYPLAGRPKDGTSIDCNDQGVRLIEAKAKLTLPEFLQQSDCFAKLVPGRVDAATSSTNDIAMVLVTDFQCGGIAISVSISHKIADATSAVFFFRSWAARIAGDDSEAYHPDFDTATRMPKPDPIPDTAEIPPFIKTGRTATTKRFRFDAEAVAALKANSCSSICKQKPSRVEAVSAFLCKSIAATMKARSGKERPICTTHLFDVRRRTMPPFPDSYMGNYVGSTFASLGVVDEDTELSDLVIKMREAIAKTFHSAFVKRSGNETTKERDDVAGGNHNSNVPAEYIAFNSFCNMGLYDIDFGWGNPVWITTTQAAANFGNSYINTVFLMDTRSKGEVEAWITLDEEEIALLLQDEKLIAFAAVDPNPMT